MFQSEGKLISLDNKNCTLKNGKKVTCTTLRSCLKYRGVNLPAAINYEVTWTLDSLMPMNPRMFFLNNEGNRTQKIPILLTRGNATCRTETVYIAENIREKLKTFQVEMKYNIRESRSSTRKVRSLEPVLDSNQSTVVDTLNIIHNCGKDNFCIPDLKLEVKTNDAYILGGLDPLVVDVNVTNEGEEAYEAIFYMNIPEGLDYKKTKKIGDSRETSHTCTVPSALTNYTLKCDLGNPLPNGRSVNFRVILEPSTKKFGSRPVYEFFMEANSSNIEDEGNRMDNKYTKSVIISVESDLSISGSSSPEPLHYNASQYKTFKNASHEADIGPQVVHIYDIKNTGTSSIEEVIVYINWPALTLDNEPLMYLLNQPETSGRVKCFPTQYVNNKNLVIDQQLSRKSFLDKNGAAVRSGEVESSFTSDGHYNSQGGVYYEEKFIDENKESGDASFVHKNRSYHSQWETTRGTGGRTGTFNWSDQDEKSGSFGTQYQANSGSSGRRKFGSEESSTSYQGSANENSQGFSTGSRTNQESGSQHTSEGRGQHESGGRRQHESGGRINYNWENRDQYESESGRNTGFDSRSGYSSESEQNSRSGGRSQYGTEVTGGRSGYNYENEQNSRGGGRSQYGTDGSGVRTEYEYKQEWNSSSVNGGPVITQYSSQNQSFATNKEGKRVLIDETSTQTVITGGVGYGAAWGGHSENREHSNEDDYEIRRQKYYENIRKIQEEEERRRVEDRKRLQNEQWKQEDEERRRLEHEERIRQLAISSGSQTGSSTSYDSSYARNTGSRGQSGGSR
jgi:integrin alpha 8